MTSVGDIQDRVKLRPSALPVGHLHKVSITESVSVPLSDLAAGVGAEPLTGEMQELAHSAARG